MCMCQCQGLNINVVVLQFQYLFLHKLYTLTAMNALLIFQNRLENK